MGDAEQESGARRRIGADARQQLPSEGIIYAGHNGKVFRVQVYIRLSFKLASICILHQISKDKISLSYLSFDRMMDGWCDPAWRWLFVHIFHTEWRSWFDTQRLMEAVYVFSCP